MARLDHIIDLRTFEAVARLLSLTAAAREMGLSLAVVSKRLQRLEASMKVRLADRTTRAVRLTQEGERFLQDCQAILAATDRAEDALADGVGSGTIRISASVAFAARQIAPRLPLFLDRHPGLSVEILSGDRLVDLLEDRIDVAFRQLPEDRQPSLSRAIAPDRHVLVASPAYVELHGKPEHPAALAHHRCLTVGLPAPITWRLTDGCDVVDVPLAKGLSGNDGEVAHVASLAGGGIAMKSAWDVLDDVAAGRLVQVLPNWDTGGRCVFVVSPMRQYQPRRVAALVAFLQGEFKHAAEAWQSAKLLS